MMSLYQQIATFALNSSVSDASEAWRQGQILAEQAGLGTTSSRAKGCPKSAFISLAENGYISGFTIVQSKALSENARHALAAYHVQLERPDIIRRKTEWWRETAKARATERQGQNGVLDVLLAALETGRFIPRRSQI